MGKGVTKQRLFSQEQETANETSGGSKKGYSQNRQAGIVLLKE
jgi:hypothetical protein